jgi:hypothetical protein
MRLPATILGSLACTCGVVLAQTVMVGEDGLSVGGWGSRDYIYLVESPLPMMQFGVGCDDTDATAYTSVLKPAGWSFELRSGGLSQRFGVNTWLGDVAASAPTVGTELSAVWFTTNPALAVTSFEFGFNHAWAPTDVGWLARGRTTGTPVTAWSEKEDWTSPVGLDYGPIHGPGYQGTLCQSSCGGLQYCEKPPGACGGTGVCKPKPQICAAFYAPVCGCNNQTYSNSACASVYGINIAYYGVCSMPAAPPPYDQDGDGVYNGYDNCRYAANATQADTDADSVGDACDSCSNTILAAQADSAGCPPVVKGDFDRDGDVDPADATALTACMTGPGISIASGCAGKDLNSDGYVDQADFGVFQRCISGEDLPGNSQCR